jgi:hypothetical protein
VVVIKKRSIIIFKKYMQIAEVNLCFSMLLFKNAKVQLMFADFTT